ncbi:MAG: hypothetical protein GH151_10560 [Bacteroidetes bacterium]|jgi:hypothetical protein|nr:hypothetical protein [Bacteroidota bacterium]
MPECVFYIRGSIADFTRIDNLYTALRREADKLLKEWEINAEIKYSEKGETKPTS